MKPLFIIGLIALIISVSLLAYYDNPNTNCWDRYTNEHDAIMNCEVHE